MTDLPELLRNWKTPWSMGADGIKDANGCWIMSASNTNLAKQMVDLANYAAALTAAPASAAGAVDVWQEAISIAEDYALDAQPDSEYRLACNDLIERFREKVTP